MNTTSETFKTISYKLIRNGSLLIVIFPRAGAKFTSHSELINELSKFGSVLFLEGGYYGISKADHNSEDLSIDKFYLSLHKLINKLGFAKIALVGESVGAIHALNYASNYSSELELLILSNPALYKPRFIDGLLIVPILNLGIKTSPDRFLNALGKALKKFPTKGLKNMGNTFMGMTQTIGSLSYLICLTEIAEYKNKYRSKKIKNILNKTYALIGKNDKVFDLLCDKDYCMKYMHYKEVNSAGHGIINSNPNAVTEIFRKNLATS